MVCSVDRLALDRCKALNEARETEGMLKPRLPSARPRENRGKKKRTDLLTIEQAGENLTSTALGRERV